jgi:hypothetical protein
MCNRVDGNSFQTVEYFEHPSVTPLLNFHGHIVKTFSALPQKGKAIEVAKRISLAIASPFTYLILAFIALIGYPYARTFTKQIPLENSEDSKTLTADDRSLLIVDRAKQEMNQSVGNILEESNISKIKYLINRQIANEKKVFEIDIHSESGFIKRPEFMEFVKEPMREVEKWLIEKFKAHGIDGEVTISGQAFCLGDENIHHASWVATDRSTKDSVNFSATNSTATPSQEHCNEYLTRCLKRLGIDLPENTGSPASFFNTKLITE